MSPVILLDTGPLIASLSKRDSLYLWAEEQIKRLPLPLLTCEAVITEACFLAYRTLGSGDSVLEFIQTGAVKLDFNLAAEVDPVKTLMSRYANVPMSLADACLVRMSELYQDSLVLTTDSDFTIYRRHKNQPIQTLMPPL